MRIEQLAREPFCKYCLDLGIEKAASVADHETPHRGDPDLFWFGKLQSLCAECHSGAKQELEETGKLRGGNAAGEPVDPNHHWNNE